MVLPTRCRSSQAPRASIATATEAPSPSPNGCRPSDVERTADDRVTTHYNSTDQHIIHQLERLSESDEDYWTFRRRGARRQAQGLIQYPAMMVPAMQAELIRVVAGSDRRVRSVLDPFAGCGTTLVESMRLGLDFAGQDINPLAVLFCRSKAGPFHTNKLGNVVTDIVQRAAADRGKRIESDFPGLEKWFSLAAITELSRLRRAIRKTENTWCRRVLWTALAETVRLTSNSRTSTFKLHIRSPDDLRSRKVHVLNRFAAIATDIAARLRQEAATLRQSRHLTPAGYYRGNITIQLGDSTKVIPSQPDRHDLLVTSPPYGDNTSTVPYGQYSYLPLQWIDLHDIDERADENIDADWLCSTCEIDRRSLGGSKRNAVEDVEQLMTLSPSLAQTLERLEELPPDRAQRVAAFCRDLNASLGAVTKALKPCAYMLWTVGNRRVGGQQVPTDAILEELLAAKKVHLIQTNSAQDPEQKDGYTECHRENHGAKKPFSCSERSDLRRDTRR